MTTTLRSQVLTALAAQLFILLAANGCTPDPTSGSQEALTTALRNLDRDDLEISYYQLESRMEMRVDVEEFAELARGFTIEMLVDVTVPGGESERHQLSWTSGEDSEVPRITLPAGELGRYEMVLTRVAIDGHALDGLTVRTSMDVGTVVTSELSVLAPEEDSVTVNNCGPGIVDTGDAGNNTLHGSNGNDTLDGLGGKDVLYGYECKDVLRGGPGNDNLFGGPGGDDLRGGDGSDICRGGDGHDVCASCELECICESCV